MVRLKLSYLCVSIVFCSVTEGVKVLKIAASLEPRVRDDLSFDSGIMKATSHELYDYGGLLFFFFLVVSSKTSESEGGTSG